MSAIEDKKITFYTKIIDGTLYKYASSEIDDPDISHVMMIKGMAIIDEHI
jgi:hypothetical protein